MTTAITTKNGQQLARPLKVLVPLIRRDVENAKHAGKMFYISAGQKLVEAKKQTPKGEWEKWIEDNFEFNITTARVWMAWWEAENDAHASFDTQEDFRRSRSPRRKTNAERKYREYHTPVDRILSGISAKEMQERAANAAKEHELERNLALKLINIGYKVLSIKLHPDKGGSHDAMRRLNKVRARLKEAY